MARACLRASPPSFGCSLQGAGLAPLPGLARGPLLSPDQSCPRLRGPHPGLSLSSGLTHALADLLLEWAKGPSESTSPRRNVWSCPFPNNQHTHSQGLSQKRLWLMCYLQRPVWCLSHHRCSDTTSESFRTHHRINLTLTMASTALWAWLCFASLPCSLYHELLEGKSAPKFLSFLSRVDAQ